MPTPRQQMLALRSKFYRQISRLPQHECDFPIRWETIRAPNGVRVTDGIQITDGDYNAKTVGKYIAYVQTTEDAEKLLQFVQAQAQEINEEGSRVAQSIGQKWHTLSVRAKTINPSGNLSLTVSEAEQRLTKTGEGVQEIIDGVINIKRFIIAQLKKEQQESEEIDDSIQKEIQEILTEIARLQSIRPNFDNDAQYRCGIPTGLSYRITYYDKTMDRRQQLSAGHLVIAVTDSDATELIRSVKRKQREDKLEPEEHIGAWRIYFRLLDK